MARQRLTTAEAAKALGITPDAVRKRASRGQLASEKDPDGKLYIWLDADTPPTGHDGRDILIEFLRSELALWQEEARRKDHIIAALTERIPELPPPDMPSSDTRESSVSASEEPDRGKVPPEEERRSWWRRFFGF